MGVVGGADHGGGFHMSESLTEAFLAIFIEFVGVDIVLERIMVGCGLEVLADGHHFAAYGAEVFHGLDHFFFGLT